MTLDQFTDHIIKSVTDSVSKVAAKLRGEIAVLREELKRIPAGPRGEKGDSGAPGAKGEKGDKGDVGERGEKGEKGDRGDTGPAGAVGERGADGAAGLDGAQGPRGEKGEKGDTGLPGERGEKGDVGPQGERGEPGVIGKEGAPGERGPQGERGEPGSRGEKGEPGQDGKDGAPGERGVPGEPGATGERGEKGDPGREGKDGRDGRDGKDGAPGVRGERGDPGRDALAIEVLSAIDESKSYPRGTFAEHRGGTIYSIRQTDPINGDLSSAGWSIAMRGISEETEELLADGRTIRRKTTYTCGRVLEREIKTQQMIYRDIYRPETEYDKGDVVTWAGSTWIAKVDKPTDKPGVSEQWQLIVKKGRDAK